MWKRKVILDVYSTTDSFRATFSEHRIDFVMQSYLGWSADEMKIDIYNLDPGLVTKLYQLENKEFTLSAGYDDEENVEELMTGRIVNVWGRKSLPHHITTMWCVPLSAIQNNNKAEPETFKNTTVKSLIHSLVTKAGYKSLSTKFVGFDKDDSRLSATINTYTTHGTLVQELDKLGQQYNFRFNCAATFVKIVSNTISNNTIDLMKDSVGGVDVHKISLYNVKGTPEISVASTNIVVNLKANIKAGDVLDYSLLSADPLEMQSIFSVSGENATLFRDPALYKYIINDQYQILTVTHTGSNFAPVWDTAITGTIFNKYVTVGDDASQDSTGVKGFSPRVADIQFNTDGSLSAFFPGNADYTKTDNAHINKQAANAAAVKLTNEQQQILYEVAGQDEQKRQMLETVLRVENRGFGQANNNAVSPVGAKGAFQFMPQTAKNLGVNDRTDFRQSAEGASRYVDEVRNRYGGNIAPEVFYADYNAGPRVSGPLARGEQVDMPQETQDYLAIAKALEGGE